MNYIKRKGFELWEFLSENILFIKEWNNFVVGERNNEGHVTFINNRNGVRINLGNMKVLPAHNRDAYELIRVIFTASFK